MSDVEEVRMTGQDTSDWRMKGPLGKSAQFDARTTEMDPGRTRTDVTMNYADPPDDAVGEAILNVLPTPKGTSRRTSRTSPRS